MSAPYKIAIKVPEEDLAAVVFMIQQMLQHNNKKSFRRHSEYTPPECLRMGISKKCLRAMQETPLFMNPFDRSLIL